jgi:hypothetical protein
MRPISPILTFAMIATGFIPLASPCVQAQNPVPASGVTFAKANTTPSPVLYPYSIAAADLSSGGALAMGVVGVERRRRRPQLLPQDKAQDGGYAVRERYLFRSVDRNPSRPRRCQIKRLARDLGIRQPATSFRPWL